LVNEDDGTILRRVEFMVLIHIAFSFLCLGFD